VEGFFNFSIENLGNTTHIHCPCVKCGNIQLFEAHLYVLEDTEEVLPYIEEHMIHIKTTYPKFKKRIKLLQDKHNNIFIQWLRFK
ncbi:PREDICTED: LOC110880131 isoform, partial [Prunus dulcis]